MGSRGRLSFDLNEPPAEEEDEMDSIPPPILPPLPILPQKSLPTSSLNSSALFQSTDGPRIVSNHSFTHASSVSGFQPFIRSRNLQHVMESLKLKTDDLDANEASTSSSANRSTDNKVLPKVLSGGQDSQATEREEGELCDTDGNVEIPEKQRIDEENKQDNVRINTGNGVGGDNKQGKLEVLLEPVGSGHLNSTFKGDATPDCIEKSKDSKGVEASYPSKLPNIPGKRPNRDEHKDAMLGKKRARQTVFINPDDVKHAGPMKISTPKRPASVPSFVTRTVKSQPITKVLKQSEVNSEGSDQNAEPNGDASVGSRSHSKKIIGNESPSEVYPSTVSKQDSWKQFSDTRQFKNQPAPSRKPTGLGQSIVDLKVGNKKPPHSKKQNSNNFLYQDTSVERLHREVTNDKFWHHPEETDLQCVPGHFESVEEYVQVFEPLLFEECRAQLYSTWEELTETIRDAHIMVRVKTVERRERGWYDVIVLPTYEYKWNFKEGDVAILSSPKPGAAGSSRRNNGSASKGDSEHDISGRVVGTVRRHNPTDSRDPMGAILHFYVGDTYDSSNKMEDDHILKKFLPKSVWYLTALGSLATTQREYVALHAFHRLSLQMQNAILKPSPEHFPKYEEQPPAMPECFTPSFTDHLHRTFNGPQLAAIQWAAMHTAAGTSSSAVKRQDPWPFTLVQGPPGTGKTHTVWGMLNVIHLVQYQHYYTALLKKLAPESLKQASETTYESGNMNSIDEVLQSMDQNLFRTLPKLCPKPRMLVCAPSNAATDELLGRVLDRGFIDGEMKVYRPDVARVGVDTQTRGAQAVSVERRTEQLLFKGREEVIGWMHQLRAREAQYSQQIAHFQRQLNAAAAVGRSQGSVGVDPDVLVARDQNRDVLLQNLASNLEGRDKVLVELSRLYILEGRFRPGVHFNLEEARSQLEASFANEAEIVFTTVSSSGRKLFSHLTHGFDMVVIDEAAQASEVAVLPPLSLGAARCVLVGDPQQLPATVISKAAGTLLYSRSLFERFQQAGCPTMLLSVQYRMHPQIRDFPSRYFYQGRLTDSESVASMADEVYYKDSLLQPYMFFDIMHGRESHRGGSVSYQNVHEAQFTLRLYGHLHMFLKSNGGKKVTVGIITPYKLQLKCLQREFEEVLKSEDGKDLYINTVDAFQGQERDVIIMSCVRASNHGVGFVADIRRMNVALTRARRALWVVGNANALMQSDDWASLITDAKSRNCFKDMDSIPKELLILRRSASSPEKVSSNNLRSLRGGGQRHRPLDMLPDAKSGIPSEAEDMSNSSFPLRNGSYRDLEAVENTLWQNSSRGL